MVSTFDIDLEDDESNNAAMNLAFERLNDVGAVHATFDEESNELDMDMSPLLGGIAVSIQWLVSLLAEVTPLSREDVIVKLREFLDSDSAGDN